MVVKQLTKNEVIRHLENVLSYVEQMYNDVESTYGEEAGENAYTELEFLIEKLKTGTLMR